MRRTIFLIASVIVSAFFLWLALRGIPLQDIVDRLLQANPLWVAVSIFMVVAGVWTRGVRWRGMLNFKPPLLPSFYMMGISFLVNQLPLRAGDVGRSLLATRYNVSFITAATSVFVEKFILDTLLVVIILLISLGRLPDAPPEITRTTTFFGIGGVISFFVLLYLARSPKLAHNILDWIEARLPIARRVGLTKLLGNVLDGLQPLSNWRSLGHALLWTLISWVFSFLGVYVLLWALDIQGIDMVLCSLLVLTLASFSIAVPVSMAAIGPFEYAVILGATAVGVPELEATSLGFLFHGTNIIGYAICGIIGLMGMGVSLGDMMSARATPQTNPAPNEIAS
jgi:glycosyltransferase 2 family protein